MTTEHHAGEVAAAAVKASPPLAISGMYLAGYSLQDWLVLATLVYTVLQILLLLPKFHKQYKDWRASKNDYCKRE